MKNRKFLIVAIVAIMMTVASCGRKGTGCPTFSKISTESNTTIDKI